MELKPGLYIISTPIGNILDITLRSIKTLERSDVIFCEDTSNSIKLLEKLSINYKKLEIYNDYSTEKARKRIKSLISEGMVISLISDAGTPLISDPGYKLVQYMIEEKIYFDFLPGATAPVAALVLSGLPTDKFTFLGFIEKTQIRKEKQFEKVKNIDNSLIFFDSPKRILDSLIVALKILGDRKAAVLKEITKKFQNRFSGKISDIIDEMSKINIKGEIVLVIDGKKFSDFSKEDAIKDFNLLISEGYSKKTASEEVISKYGNIVSKSELYKI